MKTTQYTNFSILIFEGFYESGLYDSDRLYWVNENQNECNEDNPTEWDIDFPKFQKEVCEEVAYLLGKYTRGKIISKIEFVKLDSPKEYNYRTDRLVLNVEYDERELSYFLQRNKEDFDNYLRTNWSSRPGFISFVENSYEEFMKEKNFNLDIAIEYVLLRQIYGTEWNPDMKKLKKIDTEYHSELYETVDETFYNCLFAVEKSTSQKNR